MPAPAPPPSERDALIEALVRKFRQQLAEQLPDKDQTLDQIEEVAGRVGNTVSQDIQKHLTDKQTRKRPAERQHCACGKEVRYKGHKPRQIVTCHGLLRLRRAIYYCQACQKNTVPSDLTLGLDAGSYTTPIRVWTAHLAALLPFAQAAHTLETLTRVSLSAATLERIALAVGNALRQTQQAQVQSHQTGDLAEPAGKARRRLYIGMDGVFVPLREEWTKDGSKGALSCRYGECKVGVVYEPRVGKSGDDCILTRTYTATMGNAEAFGTMIAALAHQEGHHRCRDVVVLADGAAWIWQIAAKQFNGATQIVDYFHACQHLSSVAEARYGAGNAEGKAWHEACCEDLLQDRLANVLKEIKEWQPRSEVKRALRRTEYGYFVSNTDRMRYKSFRERGYHIGSGVVEAGCKQMATQRMKLAGMHWRAASAEAVLTLRASQLSTQVTDLRPYCGMLS